MSDAIEQTLGTDSFNPDTDGDGVSDGDELIQKTDPLTGGFDVDPNDLDGDGLSNDLESGLGTDPQLADSDQDGIMDGEEVALGQDPLIPNGYGAGGSETNQEQASKSGKNLDQLMDVAGTIIEFLGTKNSTSEENRVDTQSSP